MKNKQEIFLITKKCLTDIPQTVELYRKNHFNNASWKMENVISGLKQFAELLMSKNVSTDIGHSGEFMQILKAVLQSQEQQDYILLADILQGDLYPFLQQFQLKIMEDMTDVPYPRFWQENLDALGKTQPELRDRLLNTVETDYVFFITPAVNGLPVMKYLKDGTVRCMHSTLDPEAEAAAFADQFDCENIRLFYLYGMGLGYHVRALLDHFRLNRVTVLERELQVLIKALRYQNLAGYLEDGRLQIIYEQSLPRLASSLRQEKDQILLVHPPSLSLIEDGEEKRLLENYFIFSTSLLEGRKLLYENFERLRQKNLPECKEARDLFHDKDVVIAAAGPSLDLQIEALKKWKNRLAVLSVGTVAKKLLGEGIRPDAVIISDAHESVCRQIEGIDGQDMPLLLLSTASADAAEHYRGRVCIIYQSGYGPAEKLAAEKGYPLYETGGSVTTLALDLALRFHPKRIILAGTDFAYTGRQSHAAGLGKKIPEDIKLRTAESVDGSVIETSRGLDSYRRWIENRIRDVADIEIYNTARGARIHGTKESGLDEIMSQTAERK